MSHFCKWRFNAALPACSIAFAPTRWAQTAFVQAANGRTPRNLMGFKDGTQAAKVSGQSRLARNEGPKCMQGWDHRSPAEFPLRWSIGIAPRSIFRSRRSAATSFPAHPLDEFAPLGLDRTDGDQNPIIPEHAHVRMANAAISGRRNLRRGYSYNDGVNFVAERWPPWHQVYDAGLLFICYQSDPRAGFIKLFDDMAEFDMPN